MAEIAVGLVIDKLIPLLSEEAYLLRGIHKEIEGIKCDMDFLFAFLKDADARVEIDQNSSTSHGVKVWVENLRNAAFRVEDVIDEYTHLMVQQNHPHSPRFIEFVRRSACLMVKLKRRHDIGSKIKDIKQAIRDINQTSASYGFSSTRQEESTYSSRTSTWYDPRKSSCFLKECDIVGIDSSKEELTKKTNFWGDMQNVLPDSEKNGRVVITTRYVNVANFCKVSSCVHIHHLKHLPSEKAWELFCRKAFQYELDGCCPPHLYKLSREIVERCEGLPLAIVVIAGLLSTKNYTTDEWKNVLNTLSSELQSNEHLECITKILSLSYNDLPYHLKSCFLYLGYFPEDYSIRCGRIIRQWIAEGFVKSKKDKTLETVAKEYLVRSIFMFDKEEVLNHLITKLTINFKLLKVLDFEDASNLNHLSKEIGNLFHLKYLSVRGTRVGCLPRSIGRLENLETLDLKQSLVFVVPIEIKRLQKLRHLSAYHANLNEVSFSQLRGVTVDGGIGRLKTLQKLYYIDVNVTGVNLFKELCKLTDLRKLGIKNLRSEDGRSFCDCIQNMNNLESLSVTSISEDETIDLESMSSPPQFLRRLYIQGPMKNLPEWITQLQNLTRIGIYWSKLEIDPLSVFQNMHNLLEVRIFNDGYYGEKLHFKNGTFPTLKVLYLKSLSKLRLIVLEEKSLCHLEEFFIGPCPQLKELPFGLHYLRNLKKVYLRELPTIFLMSKNFQTLQNTGLDIRLLYKINGKLWSFRLELWITDFLEYLRDHVRKEEWESKLDNLFSERASDKALIHARS
ncbi:hypothetical protein CsatB_000809 [Cannabis sativa]